MLGAVSEEPSERDQQQPEEQRPAPPVVEPGGVPWGLLAFLALAVVLVVFTWQNTQDVSLRFLSWQWRVPLAVLIIGVLVAGMVLDEIIVVVARRRRRRRAAERAELHRLRAEGR